MLCATLLTLPFFLTLGLILALNQLRTGTLPKEVVTLLLVLELVLQGVVLMSCFWMTW